MAYHGNIYPIKYTGTVQSPRAPSAPSCGLPGGFETRNKNQQPRRLYIYRYHCVPAIAIGSCTCTSTRARTRVDVRTTCTGQDLQVLSKYVCEWGGRPSGGIGLF